MSKPRLQVNVSGGRTSAYMAWWLKANMSERYEMIFVFANTGAEHPDTYRFLRAVDEHFGLDLVLLEAVVHDGRVSSSHRIVTHDTLSTNGEPFDAVASKYGISNVAFKHCNRELKFNPMASYAKSVWPEGDYEIAIGIRPDEGRRVSPSATKQGIVYPLVHWHPQGSQAPDKAFVLDWCGQFDWDLKIAEAFGNCVTCYKKSDRKLREVWRNDPAWFELFARMEREYGHVKPLTDPTPGGRRWWRGYRSTGELLDQFAGRTAEPTLFDDGWAGGCGESCEPYEMVELTVGAGFNDKGDDDE